SSCLRPLMNSWTAACESVGQYVLASFHSRYGVMLRCSSPWMIASRIMLLRDGSRPVESRRSRCNSPRSSGMSDVSIGPSIAARSGVRSDSVAGGRSAADFRMTLPAADFFGITLPFTRCRGPCTDDSSDPRPAPESIGPGDAENDPTVVRVGGRCDMAGLTLTVLPTQFLACAGPSAAGVGRVGGVLSRL